MPALPEYIPEAAAAAYAVLLEEWLDGFDPSCLDRLIHRPCMTKVYQALAKRLPQTPEPWRRFFKAAILATLPAEYWRDTIKPARKHFEQQRAAALRAGREMQAALLGITDEDAWHGYSLPPAIQWPGHLLERAAQANGYSRASARALCEPLQNDLSERLDRLIRGDTDHPQAPRVTDMLAALLHTLEEWRPQADGDLFPGQTQGAKPPQVYVRALAVALDEEAARFGVAMPDGRLLSYDNLARVTRAALDLPDEPPEESAPSGYLSTPESRAAKANIWKPFDGEDVRRALAGPA